MPGLLQITCAGWTGIELEKYWPFIKGIRFATFLPLFIHMICIFLQVTLAFFSYVAVQRVLSATLLRNRVYMMLIIIISKECRRKLPEEIYHRKRREALV